MSSKNNSKKEKTMRCQDEENLYLSEILLYLFFIIMNDREFLIKVEPFLGSKNPLWLEFKNQIKECEKCAEKIISKLSQRKNFRAEQSLLFDQESVEFKKEPCWEDLVSKLRDDSQSIREKIVKEAGKNRILLLSKNQTLFIFETKILWKKFNLINLSLKKGK